MNILMISPEAPPKNAPEAMQVGRYLKELDKHHKITLVTTPVGRGWVTKDDSLDVKLSNTDVITLKLPFHSIAKRVLSSKYFKRFAMPDNDFWIHFKISSIVNQLTSEPDIIYSRSLPFSSALLAKELKYKLAIPWVMHLSDPWFDGPYRVKSQNEALIEEYELSCFREADAITVTTESVAQFYRTKYPEAAKKIFVSPNVMPERAKPMTKGVKINNEKLSLVYTGALYGERRATTVLSALNFLKKVDPNILDMLEFRFVGNITDDIKEEISEYNFSQVSILGRCDYNEVLEIQEKADIMISIEPDGDNPLLKTFLPSKMLDYISAGKPVLAVTPENSESWKLCNLGYGWAIKPDDGEALGRLLIDLVHKHQNKPVSYLADSIPKLKKFTVKYCVDKLIHVMERLLK